MNKPIRTLVVAALLGGCISVPTGLRADAAKPAAKAANAAAEKQWTDLLPGGDLTRHWQTTGNWKAKEGAVHLEPREGEKGWTRYDAYLWLKDKQYRNFEFEFDYMVQPKGNSGFYFHVGDLKEPVKTGVEVQLYDSASKKADAKLTDHDSGGVIPGVPPKKNTSKPAGDWNTMNVKVQGDKLTVTLNGEVVNEVDLSQGKLADRPKIGYIGFQDHGLPLGLRKMKVREL